MEFRSEKRRCGYETPPLVSIIVVVFRAGRDLPSILQSVIAHKEDDLELVVVDGCSEDGTVEYLQAQGDKIDYWVSEPDRGLYDAMNKAVAKARGTFVLHLNVGDRLLHIPRRELLEAKRDNIDIAAFRVSVDGRREFKPSAGPRLKITNTLHHQGTFYRRDTMPPYDLRYGVFADYDVNQKLALAGARIRIFPTVVAFHANNGISNRNGKRIEIEFFSVIEKNHGRWLLPLARAVRMWQGLRIMLGF